MITSPNPQKYYTPKGWTRASIEALVKLAPYNRVKVISEFVGKPIDEVLTVAKRMRLI